MRSTSSFCTSITAVAGYIERLLIGPLVLLFFRCVDMDKFDGVATLTIIVLLLCSPFNVRNCRHV